MKTIPEEIADLDCSQKDKDYLSDVYEISLQMHEWGFDFYTARRLLQDLIWKWEWEPYIAAVTNGQHPVHRLQDRIFHDAIAKCDVPEAKHSGEPK